MTDEIQLLRDARPLVAGPRPELRDEQRRQLLAAIEPARRERRFGRRPLAALVAAATSLAIAVSVVAGLGSGGDKAWAASAVRVAEAAPRLLVEGPGWRVTRADEFSAEVGEITFAAGSRKAEIRWLPARERASALTGSEGSSDLVTTASVMGVTARVFHYEGIDGFTALWVSGVHAIELEGNAADLRAFRALLGSVRAVDVDAWLSAMPDSVVRPGSREGVVSGMLAGIPLPQGFDRSKLDDGSTVRDPYQLGARVVAAVSCGWIEQWIAAKRAGDTAAVTEAVNAMGTSSNWQVLRQMESEGAYPAIVREYADAMARNGNVVGRYSAGDLTVEESFRSTLGCPRP